VEIYLTSWPYQRIRLKRGAGQVRTIRLAGFALFLAVNPNFIREGPLFGSAGIEIALSGVGETTSIAV
jgi:hypothetical protein